MQKKSTKYKPHLVYSSLIKSVAIVREIGIKKYGGVEDSWKETPTMEFLDAARRHIDICIEAIRNNKYEDLFDSETNESHYAHAVSNLMFEIERLNCSNKERTK